ncbi:MAG TPA: hypothetical protein PKE35_12020 [Anaerolineales bacterium]|nr:hypothetical protein [Anaerolineales bacterium]HMV95985.1 hypothetical protein [Anaerolineales bacterium]HMX20777.1 hypothetical protein [Anaerolineales bacterium]HMX74972.1 hypothetical protein [Anaerolineales bacterium]HMZ43824.1 hypothetical protein [Anaerolineales bacterium]
MSFDEPNFDDAGDAPLPEESNNNRTFLIAVGILGGIILISIACLGAVYVFGSQGRAAVQETEVAGAAMASATANAVNETVNRAITATFEASILPTATTTFTVTPTSPVGVASATPTPDPALAGLSGTSVAQTATIGAAYTQAALAALSTVPPTSTALPNTGFADEFGLPGIVVMSLAFVIVILLARRLRSAPETIR